MSRFLKSLVALLVVISLASRVTISADYSGRPSVPIGAGVPDLTFTDIRALRRSLSDLGEHKAIVLVFTTTDCPLVRRYIPRLGTMKTPGNHASDSGMVPVTCRTWSEH